MDLLLGLNDAQKLAVTQTEGPVMVMAGAGSGKTKVLTTRISYLISELGINPSSILAVTFTNKAANEMKERISKMLSIETNFMWISTFHSFCSRLLRYEADALEGYSKYFNIIDEEDSLKKVKEAINILDFDYKPKEIRKLISKSKNFPEFKIKDFDLSKDFPIILRKYNELLKSENLLDFDDLIIKAIELFTKNPNILNKYQNKFQYILVDEFQDTNTLQYNLIKLLSLRHHNLFVVGDDFQSIYSFRGAKIENINRIRRDYIETQLILLEKNYRSTTEILNLANCVIKNNPNQIKKVMTSNNKNGLKPRYYHADSSYDEVMFVIDNIKKFLIKGDKYSDIAIMYRSNFISRNFEDQLIRYQIPYKIYGGLSFFARKEIKDMIAYLRLLVHKNDDFSFKRVVNEPKKKIGQAIINKLTELANNQNISLYEAIPYYTGKGQGATALIQFKAIIDSITAQLENIPLKKLIDLIIKETGYEEELKKDEDSYLDRLANIKEFQSVLKETEETYDGLSHEEMLKNLLSDLALRSDNDEVNEENAVILTTYHQAKGLEFKNVFMVAMEEGIFPSCNSLSDFEIEEERRICYVGITRAKENLFLTNCENRMLYGQYDNPTPSRFIREMDKDLYENVSRGYNKPIQKPQIKTKEVLKKEEAPKTNENTYDVGDKINHKVFGDGLVVAVNGKAITVAFPSPTGIKILSGNHPSIRKL